MEIPPSRYAKSGEVHVAYQVLDAGQVLDIVYVQGAFTDLGVMWELPAFRSFCEQLGSFARLILFDKRGWGLSDRVLRRTLEERMDDVRAVMDAAGLRPCSLARRVRGRPIVLAIRGCAPRTDRRPGSGWSRGQGASQRGLALGRVHNRGVRKRNGASPGAFGVLAG